MYTFESLPLDQHLLHLAEGGNAAFTRRLHPGVEGVLGIRMADLRNLARRIARQDAAAYLHAVETAPETEHIPYMEARTLHALVLGYIKPTSVDDYLAHVARWVPRINSWSVCDAFQLADARRLLAEHNERIWDFAGERIDSDHEYTVRFGVVLLMLYFIESTHVSAVLERLCAVRHEGYYVRAHGRGLGGGRVLYSLSRAHPARVRAASPAPVDAQQSLAENSRVAPPR